MSPCYKSTCLLLDEGMCWRMTSVHPWLILLNSSGQNRWFNQRLSGLHCVYYTLPYTARLSRIPCFSKKHMLLFPKHKQTFNTWAVFTSLLPNSSHPFSSGEVLVPPSCGRAQTYLNLLANFLSALCFQFAVMPNFVLPGWIGWNSHPLLPAFWTKWALGLCCRIGENQSSPVQSPGNSVLSPVGLSPACRALTQQ